MNILRWIIGKVKDKYQKFIVDDALSKEIETLNWGPITSNL